MLLTVVFQFSEVKAQACQIGVEQSTCSPQQFYSDNRETLKVLTNEILYKGISNADKARKKRKITSAFPFLRATAKMHFYIFKYNQFLNQQLMEFSTHPDDNMPLFSIISADNHNQNFSWMVSKKNAQKKSMSAVYSRGDFDEVTVDHWSHDIYRLAASSVLMAREAGYNASEVNQFTNKIIKSFFKTIQMIAKNENSTGGYNKNFVNKLTVTDKTVTGLLKDLIKKISKLSPNTALKKWVEVSNGAVSFRDDSQKPELDQSIVRVNNTSPIYKEIERAIIDYVHRQFGKQKFRESHFQIIDVALRLGAGIGSAGKQRIYILVKGYKKRMVILDVKAQGFPANIKLVDKKAVDVYLAKYSDPTTGKINHALRVLEGQEGMSKGMNEHSGWIHLPSTAREHNDSLEPLSYFTVNEVSPYKKGLSSKDINVSSKKNRKDQLRLMLELADDLGRITALGQVRSYNQLVTKTKLFKNSELFPSSAPLASQIYNTLKGRKGEFIKSTLSLAVYVADLMEVQFKDLDSDIPIQ